MQSMRLEAGQEALVARVLTRGGKTGFGFSFQLDATEARRMAAWHAGASSERPRCAPVLGHRWEAAFAQNQPVPWDCEPAFAALAWLSA